MTTHTGISGLTMRKRYDRRNPDITRVAGFTQIAGHGVRGGFEGTGTGAVMTTAAETGLPHDSGMIKHHTQPSCGVVAHIASRCGNNVCWPLTGSHHIVVAVGTGIGSLTVIYGHQSGPPGCIVVAGFAQITG